MKPYAELTRLGRLRRLKTLAEEALEAYGMAGARLRFICYNGNVIYRVDSSRSRSLGADVNPYCADRFVLRVHMVYHSTAAIQSELQWLSALRGDAGLPVPGPVPTTDGKLVTEFSVPGVPQPRKVSLLRWLDGRFQSRKLGARQVRAWGGLMARFHNHASRWKVPRGFTRPHRDWNGLFTDAAGFEHPAEVLRDSIPDRFKEGFDEVRNQARMVMKKLGRETDAYGLIHADLDINTNVLFSRGEARAIDFDDCCFAYWLHDLAFALAPWQGKSEATWVEGELLAGYDRVRTFPDSQLKHLELFKAVFNANLMLWMIDWLKLVPKSAEAKKSVRKYGDNMLRFFDSHEPGG